MRIKREKSTSTKGHYVRNADLLPAVIEAKKLGKVTDKLIGMIRMIAERYSHKHNFAGYSFREDMVSAAVINLCNNALKFNPEKSDNPFSYYTTGIHNSFLQYMAEEKKHRNIKDALLVEAGSNPSFNYGSSDIEESARISDDMEIRAEENIEDAAATFNASHPEVDIKSNTASYTQQVFAALDPGAPGKKRLSVFADLNPGPVTIYKKEDIEIDPETGKITIKPKVEEKPAKKKTKAAKKAAKKKAATKVAKKKAAKKSSRKGK